MVAFPTLPEVFAIAKGSEIVASNALGTGDYINCKTTHKLWLMIMQTGANDTDLTIGLSEATNVAGGSAQAVTATVPIWTDVNAGTLSNQYTRQIDAATIVIDATAGNFVGFMEWDPSKFSAGFSTIAVTGTGGHASNNVVCVWIAVPRDAGPNPASLIA